MSEVCRRSGEPIWGEQTTISQPVVARVPRRNVKEFWITILVKRNGRKSNCLSPEGEF